MSRSLQQPAPPSGRIDLRTAAAVLAGAAAGGLSALAWGRDIAAWAIVVWHDYVLAGFLKALDGFFLC